MRQGHHGKVMVEFNVLNPRGHCVRGEAFEEDVDATDMARMQEVRAAERKREKEEKLYEFQRKVEANARRILEGKKQLQVESKKKRKSPMKATKKAATPNVQTKDRDPLVERHIPNSPHFAPEPENRATFMDEDNRYESNVIIVESARENASRKADHTSERSRFPVRSVRLIYPYVEDEPEGFSQLRERLSTLN
eukprot:TRINITY_DN3538_c0_g3_i2.p1 TRINITY_DN3538_c0_g3~~TRINITY_DN3538_c0_g3_i2.p1  ORF type:complete len:194 (-),score=45.07 TRINITY_DN3538_c0_g3_i2:85-666(-)